MLRSEAPWLFEARDSTRRLTGEIDGLRAQVRHLDHRLRTAEAQLPELRAEVDELREDIGRSAELYDLVFKRLDEFQG
jgi:chromosome segregation ATPase